MNSLLPIGQQISSLFLGSTGPTHTIVTWQDKCLNFPFLFFLPVFISGHNDIGYGISLWSAVPDVSPCNILSYPSLLTGGKQGGRKPWCCASTVQQKPKHWCITCTVSATNPKHSITEVSVMKTNSSPSRVKGKLEFVWVTG